MTQKLKISFVFISLIALVLLFSFPANSEETFPYSFNPDLSNDGFVDYQDLILLQSAWHIYLATHPLDVTGSLSGFTLKENSPEPLSGVFIQLDSFSSGFFNTRSDQTGFYQFEVPQGGFFELNAFQPGYLDFSQNVSVEPNSFLNINMSQIPSPTETPSGTETYTQTPTQTLTFTPTASFTPTPSKTTTTVPTKTLTPTKTWTPKPTPTRTPTSTPISLVGNWSGGDNGSGIVSMVIYSPPEADVKYVINYVSNYSLNPPKVGGTFSFNGVNGSNTLSLVGTLDTENYISGIMTSRGQVNNITEFYLQKTILK